MRERFGGRFDLVLDADAFHYVLGRERRGAYLANARALLAPGGTFAARTIVGAPEASMWPALEYDPVTRTCGIAGVRMTYHGEAEEILAELAGAGFALRRWEVVERGGSRTLFAASSAG